MPPLLRRDPPAYRHPPYQGGQGGSNLKSMFNLIITSYLSKTSDKFDIILGFIDSIFVPCFFLLLSPVSCLLSPYLTEDFGFLPEIYY
ncbi:hypothetical protein B1L04_19210 [Microcystis aeruginosa KW]|uniref:Uncharacterized protein n=1 Tax=Microcystis aeruginosa KW TaxID=1960155 RepID=A0A1V4BUF4_MICAE|nr:hypothetical protein B1L04_19210 [Microcystis aeruginosa KW]